MLPGILSEKFSISFLMVPRAPITTATVVVFSPHQFPILVSRGTVMSMRRQVLSFLFFSTVSGLLTAMVLSVWMGMSHRIVALSFSRTVLCSCSYHRSFTSMPHSLQIFQCMCAAALLWRWIYSVLASSGQPETRWSMVSSKRLHSLHYYYYYYYHYY